MLPKTRPGDRFYEKSCFQEIACKPPSLERAGEGAKDKSKKAKHEDAIVQGSFAELLAAYSLVHFLLLALFSIPPGFLLVFS